MPTHCVGFRFVESFFVLPDVGLGESREGESVSLKILFTPYLFTHSLSLTPSLLLPLPLPAAAACVYGACQPRVRELGRGGRGG